jgi:DNA-directed RNA polymerase subunit omega
MLDELKEEAIVNKVGGRFKLSTLIQKRMGALNKGAKPLVDLRTPNKMAIVIEEIMQDKIYLDPTGEVQTTNMTITMNLPTPYFGGGTTVTAKTAPETPPDGGADAADDDDDE